MNFQTFRGNSVEDALAQVRAALGADALIDSTRHVPGNRGKLGGHSFVEVVAAPARAVPASSRSRRVARPTSSRAAVRAGTDQLDEHALEILLSQGQVTRELSQLRLMLDELSQGRPPKDRTRALLAAAGFEGALARTLGTGATKAARSGSRELKQWLRQRVAERLRCSGDILQREGRNLIACVGPTGVGKTTTLAKLAARAALELNRSVRVITLDTFRVGAVEQWRRYAELIGFPLDVVTNPGSFHRIVHNHAEDLVLVDTPGRGTQDDHCLLEGCMNGLRDIYSEVLLVLPAWLRARDAARALSGYGVPAASGVVITKLDETDQVGGAMHVPLERQLPIAFLCDGARVPEDIRAPAVEDVVDAIFPEKA